MKVVKLIEKEGTCWYVLGRDPEKSPHVIDTNEYLITFGGKALLLDPGGTEIFPHVVSAVGEVISLENLTQFFGSHQDPDILSSLPLWMGLCPEAKVYLPSMWSGFISHFGHEYVDRFIKIPDEGMELRWDGREPFALIPAHYCHASGNFMVFDQKCGVLFTGDMGAALLPPDHQDLFVQDFETHCQFMKGFHQRWMPSNRAKNHWVSTVRKLDVKYLCPQHGAIFTGENIPKFLDWMENLEVGLAVPR